MGNLTVEVRGTPVTVYRRINMTHVKFVSIGSKLLLLKGRLAEELGFLPSDVEMALTELADLSSQCSPHPDLAETTDTLDELEAKARAWILADSEQYDDLRNAALRVRSETINPDTSPLPLEADADPKG